MSTPLLATRDALAEALHDAMCHEPVGECMCGPDDMADVADALLASGVVRDPATLADDARTVEQVAEVARIEPFEPEATTRHVLRALSDALSGDPS